MIMMCQCKFINSNKYPSLMGMLINRGVYVCVGTGSIWEISLNFAVKLKMLKK